MTDRSVLTAAKEAEYAGAVILSVEELRKQIVETTKTLELSSQLVGAFYALGEACRDFLTKVKRIEAEIRRSLRQVEWI